MGVTSDRNDPGLSNIGADGMQETYLVMADGDRKDFVRPVRKSYKHLTCGAVTTMGTALAETYARNPSFYSGTYCATCRNHFPVGMTGEFVWDDDGTKVDIVWTLYGPSQHPSLMVPPRYVGQRAGVGSRPYVPR